MQQKKAESENKGTKQRKNRDKNHVLIEQKRDLNDGSDTRTPNRGFRTSIEFKLLWFQYHT
jgi:hypothetical protein